MIVAAGHTAFDHIFTMQEFPRKNSAQPIDTFFDSFGGGAANLSSAILKLGEKCALFTTVGEDFAGSEYESELMGLGVNLSNIQRVPDKTAHAWMYNDYEKNHRCYFYWGASKFLKKLLIPEELIKKAKVVQFIADEPSFILKNCRHIREVNPKCKIAVDPSYDIYLYTKNHITSLIKMVDFLFLNEHEYRDVKELSGLSREQIAEKVEALIVSEGAKGCSLFFDSQSHHEPAIPVNVKDPFGAGDAHRAGFLVAREKGFELERCLKIANIVSSFVIQKEGCQAGQPTWEQVEEKLEELEI